MRGKREDGTHTKVLKYRAIEAVLATMQATFPDLSTADVVALSNKVQFRLWVEFGKRDVTLLDRTSGPSNFEVFEATAGESHGIFDTLEEARGCVEFDKIVSWTIWQGDTIVQEGGLEDGTEEVLPPEPCFFADGDRDDDGGRY